MIALSAETRSYVCNALVDGGDTEERFEQGMRQIFAATGEVAERVELRKFAVIPQRLVVERSFVRLVG